MWHGRRAWCAGPARLHYASLVHMTGHGSAPHMTPPCMMHIDQGSPFTVLSADQHAWAHCAIINYTCTIVAMASISARGPTPMCAVTHERASAM